MKVIQGLLNINSICKFSVPSCSSRAVLSRALSCIVLRRFLQISAVPSRPTKEIGVDHEKLVRLEVELYRQEGVETLPSELTDQQWKELASINSFMGRKKFLKFLFVKEMRKASVKIKKENRRNEINRKHAELANIQRLQGKEDHLKYDLMNNSIFLRFHKKTMDTFYGGRLMSAMMYGQPLVIDFDFDTNMNHKEAKYCALQTVYLLSANKYNVEPFNLYFCNYNKAGNTPVALQKYIPTILNDTFPLNITDKSYLEIFPKEKIVYLTPNAKDEIISYNPEVVYVIGAVVDGGVKVPVTKAKASKENIRMQKLPLDRYLKWGSGSGKELTINQVTSILLDLKNTGSWEVALQHVPQRKLAPHSWEDELIRLKKKEYMKRYKQLW